MISTVGLCSICNTSSLASINGQVYCETCNTYNTYQELEHQLRFVPQNYRGNEAKQMTYKEFRVISLFQKLVDTYKVCGTNDIRLLNEDFQKYKASKKKCQPYEAVTTVIFFYTYRDLLYKRMKDFAEENGINRQEFHRCYNEFSEKKRSWQVQGPVVESFEEDTEATILSKSHDFLKLIINDLCAKTSIKKNLYQECIDGILIKIEGYLKYQNNNPAIVSLIFRALKELKFRISIKNYAKICKDYGKAASPATIAKYFKGDKSDGRLRKQEPGTSLDSEEEL